MAKKRIKRPTTGVTKKVILCVCEYLCEDVSIKPSPYSDIVEIETRNNSYDFQGSDLNNLRLILNKMHKDRAL